mmetsp:Transcript_41822/g.97962  ORF Transcript_41822/g.97962 Transcript_41822/m.97962 type:complete len:241 (+) Transcript_41822:413-1135(+)
MAPTGDDEFVQKRRRLKKGLTKAQKKTNALCKLMRSRYRRHLVRSFLISLFLIIILAEFTGLVRWRMADIVPLRVYRAEEKYGYKDDAADDYEYEDDDLPPVVEEKNNGLMERLKGLRFGVPPEYDAADRHFDPEGKTVAKHLDRNAVPRPPLGQDRQYDDKNAHLSKFYSVAKKDERSLRRTLRRGRDGRDNIKFGSGIIRARFGRVGRGGDGGRRSGACAGTKGGGNNGNNKRFVAHI